MPDAGGWSSTTGAGVNLDRLELLAGPASTDPATADFALVETTGVAWPRLRPRARLAIGSGSAFGAAA